MASILFALQLAYTVTTIVETASPSFLAVRLLGLVASVAFWVASFLEHGRSIAPSTLLTVYLVFSTFSDVVQLGLLYVAKNICSPSILATFVFATGVVLLILEVQNKTPILRKPYQNLAPEELSGFLGTAFFWWVNGIVGMGHSKILSLDDMPPLATYLDVMKTREAMQRVWDNRSM